MPAREMLLEQALCPACWDDGVACLDQPHHVYYDCPSLLPLWDWTEAMLDKDEVRVRSVPAFVLYGTQLSSLEFNSTPQRLWRVQALRGAVIGAVAAARSAALDPTKPVPWRGLATRHAASLLRNAISLDFFSAQRRHDLDTHTHALDGLPTMAGQPHDIPSFGSTWAGYASVRRHRDLSFHFSWKAGQGYDGDDGLHGDDNSSSSDSSDSDDSCCC